MNSRDAGLSVSTPSLKCRKKNFISGLARLSTETMAPFCANSCADADSISSCSPTAEDLHGPLVERGGPGWTAVPRCRSTSRCGTSCAASSNDVDSPTRLPPTISTGTWRSLIGTSPRASDGHGHPSRLAARRRRWGHPGGWARVCQGSQERPDSPASDASWPAPGVWRRWQDQVQEGAKLSERSGTLADDPFGGRDPTSHERLTGLPWDASYPTALRLGILASRSQQSCGWLLKAASSGRCSMRAAGPARTRFHVASLGLSVLGVDVAETALAIARARPTTVASRWSSLRLTRSGWSVWGAGLRRCWTADCSTPSTATSDQLMWRVSRR